MLGIGASGGSNFGGTNTNSSGGTSAGKTAVANSIESAGESSRLLAMDGFSEVPTDSQDVIEERYEL
jgi:hypothetical protein